MSIVSRMRARAGAGNREEPATLFAETKVPGTKREVIKMSKSVFAKMESARKWLEKNGQGIANGKSAQAALANAEKAISEAASYKARMAEVLSQKKGAVLALDEALLRARTEKRLKMKELKLQAKIAALTAAK